MINQQRIQHLEQEASRRRSRLAQLQRELRAASDAAMSSASMNGDNLVAIAGAVQAAELSVAGIERDLAEARRPQRVIVTGSRSSLLRERDQVQQRLDWVRSQRRIMEERVLAGRDSRFMSQWRRVLLDNAGLTETAARREEAPYLERLGHIDVQLAELDRIEATGPEAA